MPPSNSMKERRPGVDGGGHGTHRIGRADRRVHRQHVLDVDHQQFLVLLLVERTELDDGELRFVQRAGGESFADRSVDVSSVFRDLVDRGPRDQPSIRTRMTGTDRVVVAVVEEPVLGQILRVLTRTVGAEHEFGEEPRRVCSVPFGGARVLHRLHHLVLRRERGAEAFGPVPHLRVPGCETIRIEALCRRRRGC